MKAWILMVAAGLCGAGGRPERYGPVCPGQLPFLALLVSVVLVGAPLAAEEGFGGEILFKKGGSVAFVHLGNLDKIYEYWVTGNLGSQRVRYDFAALGEIWFEGEPLSGGSNDPLVVVSKSGDRFVLTGDIEVHMRPNYVGLHYVYNDPVTKQLLSAKSDFSEILQISIEGKAGDMKRNPSTGEVFPVMYVFDPFTGEKLEWASSSGGQ